MIKYFVIENKDIKEVEKGTKDAIEVNYCRISEIAYLNGFLAAKSCDLDTMCAFEDEHGMHIYDPLVDSTGRFEREPVSEYGVDFLRSEFVKLADDHFYNNVKAELLERVEELCK